MPVLWSGDVTNLDTMGEKTERAWWSGFNKSSEAASPGSYSVFLDRPQVQVRLAALGTHAGVHTYEFLPNTDATKVRALIPARPPASLSLIPPRPQSASQPVSHDDLIIIGL